MITKRKLRDLFPPSGIDFDSRRDKGLQDLARGLARADMWVALAFHDIKQRYRRSLLGPFWITAVLGAQIVGIGVVYSGLFKQDIATYLPYLAAGLTVWSFISGVLVEGTTMFINAAGSIRSVVAPVSVHVFRTVLQQVIILAHNLVLILLVDIAFMHSPGIAVFFAVPGFLLCLLNLGWIVLVLGVLAARFRDIPLIVSSLTMLLLIVTPVFWHPDLLGRASYVVMLNPFYHLLELVRAPLFGEYVRWETWIGAGVGAVLGWALAVSLFHSKHNKIPFWV